MMQFSTIWCTLMQSDLAGCRLQESNAAKQSLMQAEEYDAAKQSLMQLENVQCSLLRSDAV